MSRSKTYKDLQKLLIEPTERIKFITRFVLIYSIGNLAIVYFCYRILSLLGQENGLISFIFEGLFAVSIIGLLIGACSGFLQWTIFKKHFNREWIIANGICGVYFGIKVLNSYLRPIDAFNYPGQGLTELRWALVLSLLLAIFSITLLIALGFVQRLAFKNKVEKYKWLFYLPLIASFFPHLQYFPIAGLLWFFWRKHFNTNKPNKQIIFFLLAVKLVSFILLLFTRISLFTTNDRLTAIGLKVNNCLATAGLSLIDMENIDINYSLYFTISTVLVFGTVQGLAICLLNRQSPRQLTINQEPIFASTSDLDNFAQVQSAIKKVGSRINNLWQGDFDYYSKLTYWLVVLLDGTVVDYYPLDRVSEDNFTNSPLNLLIENQNKPLNINRDRTAKLKITFAPPGTMKINSLSGVPISLLFLGTYLLLAAISMSSTLILQKIF